jgi:cytidylate kinase
MAVITISRLYGSGGDAIAEAICRLTGFRLFDKHILAKAAFEVGLSDHEAVDFCEDTYRMKNLYERLFGAERTVAQVRIWKEDAEGIRRVEERQLNEEEAIHCVQQAIKTAYRLGDYVIVGRGGQVLLKDYPDVLHARVIAPLEDRILRVRNSPTMAGRTFSDSLDERRFAQRLIEQNDTASADYLKRFYNVDWSDWFLYHLVINTAKMSTEQAATCIVEAIHQVQPAIL